MPRRRCPKFEEVAHPTARMDEEGRCVDCGTLVVRQPVRRRRGARSTRYLALSQYEGWGSGAWDFEGARL